MDRDEVLELYARIVAPHEGIAIKGAKSKYTAVNGNMFSFVDPDGTLCIRLSEMRKKEFNDACGQSDVIQYGSVMRGYVSASEALLADTEALAELFDEAVTHARSLKPKPTKKPKS